ncbi:hypothetical protein [Actinoplanes subtropicus]|uniref:hypothetical protein n=1 Tax=Actinoplanes subtropicus TaxID=543632 RepID=UPI0004C38FE8|nr:hypothetical protein [Actinoplanes subtropicus]
MGYWGHLIATGSSQELVGTAMLSAFGDQQTVAEGPPGWHVYHVAGAEPDLTAAVRALAAGTGAPAIAAYVLDSDCAIVRAATPDGARWSAVLNPERAEEYGAPGSSPDAVLAQAVTWARAAQLDHDDDLIRRAVTTEATFAEDQFLALLEAFRPSLTGPT